MFNAYRVRDVRNNCIICEERIGTIQTLDGLVCSHCMPRELLPRASSLKKHHLIIYYKSNPEWADCETGATNIETVEISDRSAAITGISKTTLADELNIQIASAESIDIVVSFIKLSGLSLILGKLTEFTRRGKLRVITTSYMGATEYEALNELFRLPNTEVRMELDANNNRLHAKSFIFNRSDGKSSAFVGSANISKTALTEGEEWVVKLREEDVPGVLEDLRSSYEMLWQSGSIKPVNQKNYAEIEYALENRGRVL